MDGKLAGGDEVVANARRTVVYLRTTAAPRSAVTASHRPRRASARRAATPRRSSLAALGGALEYYDFIIFVFFTAVIGQLFFPPDTPDWLRQLQTFGIFAAGYLARPLGGIVMAHFGDRSGRKHMFTLSVFLMAIPTLLIGLLPTYATLGYAAPLALLLLRILQGAAVGGEVPGAWTFVAEHVPERSHRLRVRHADVGPHDRHPDRIADRDVDQQEPGAPADVQAFAWRIPFLIGGVFGFFAVFLRRLLAETPVFEEMRRRRAARRRACRFASCSQATAAPSCMSMLLTWVLTAAIVVVILMTPTLIQKLFGIAAADTLAANSLATLGLSIGCIVFGSLADRFGAERMLMLGCALLLAATYALYLGLGQSTQHLDSLYAVAGVLRRRRRRDPDRAGARVPRRRCGFRASRSRTTSPMRSSAA